MEVLLNKILKKIPPSELNFLSVLSDRIDDDILKFICSADPFSADYAYNEIKYIIDNKKYPQGKISFELQEVLELNRWQNCETEKEHIARAFCCSCLIVLNTKMNVLSENETLAGFIESVLSLDEKHYEPSLQLVVWRILNDNNNYENADNTSMFESDRVYYYYSLLLLMLLNKYSESIVKEVFNYFIYSENKNRGIFDYLIEEDTFLLGITNFSQKHETWRKITGKIISEVNYLVDEKFKIALNEVAGAILDNRPLKLELFSNDL